jgi:ABC-type multidrug transport system fused ATPase/permease subunit
MISQLRSKFRKNPVLICSELLTAQDRKKMWVMSITQSFLGILDIAGIALLGLLGSLTISGVQSREPSGVVADFLKLIHIDQQRFQTQVVLVALFAVILLTAKTFLSILFMKKTLLFFSEKSAVISTNLVKKLLTGSLKSIQQKNSQDIVYSVTSGVSSISVGVLGSFVSIVSDAFLLLLIFISLFLVNFVLALAMTSYFCLIAFFLYYFLHSRAQGIGEKSAKLQIRTSRKLLEALDSFREIYVRNRESHYINSYSDSRSDFARLEAEQAFFPNISKYGMEISVIFGALFLSAALFISTDATEAAGTLALFMAAGMRTAPAILRLQQGMLNIKMQFGLALPTIKAIEELQFDSSGVQDAIDDGSDLGLEFSGSIEIKNLSFHYPDSTSLTLDDISMVISPGTTFAIVGPSAAGKSTLIDCILGLQIPSAGEILISGKKPKEAVKIWPRSIGYVPQQVTLFEGTIAENIALGFSPAEIDREAVISAVNKAALQEFVKSLRAHIDSPIGERGSNLSGGQKQRIGIARALYSNPGIVVLDEATSSLDAETERLIGDSLQSLKGKTTLVIVAHRLSTVQNSDAVAYIEDGRVLAVGSFEEVRRTIPNFDRQAKLMGL